MKLKRNKKTGQTEFDLKKVKVHRTAEGTIFEIVTAVLLIVLWVLTVVLWQKSAPTIANHFDLTGTPDGFGSRNHMFVTAVVGTVSTMLLLVSAYFPRHINLPVGIGNIRQATTAVRMVRVLAVTVALLFIGIPLSMTFGKIVPVALSGIAIILVIVFYTYKIYKQK